MNPEPAFIVLARERPFALGALTISPAAREATLGETTQVLEPRVMQVLVALARAEGQVVPRDDLVAQCWSGRIVGDDAINRVISRLRRLGESFQPAPFTIETVTKVGYRLIGEKGEAPPAEAPATRRAGVPARLRWALAALALILLVAGAMVALKAPQPPAPARIDPAARADYDRAVTAIYAGGAEEAARAVALLQGLVARTPHFAPGWSALALAHLNTLAFAPPDLQGDIVRRADAAWRRALDLDPADSDGLVARAIMNPEAKTLARVEAAQLEALAAAPGHRAALLLRGAFLSGVGRGAEALGIARRAADLDPASPRIRIALAQSLYNAGRPDDAVAAIDEAARLWPGNSPVHAARFWLLVQTGRADRALALIDDRAGWPPGAPVERSDAWRAIATGFATRAPADIDAALRAARALIPHGHDEARHALHAMAALGDLDGAFAAAETIYFGGGGRRATSVLFAPHTAAMRADPRFEPLMEALGLMAYWREAGRRPDVCAASAPPPFCAGVP